MSKSAQESIWSLSVKMSVIIAINSQKNSLKPSYINLFYWLLHFYIFFSPRRQLFLDTWLFLVGSCLGDPEECPALAQPISLSKMSQYQGQTKCFKSLLRSMFFMAQ